MAPAVIVRNQTPGPLVIAAGMRQEYEVVFDGCDDPSGGDYRHMPPEIIATPAFAKQVSIGTLVIVEGADNPAVKSALDTQSQAFWNRAENEKAAAEATIDREPEKDYLVLKCIGPGTRPDSPCDLDLPVRVTEALHAVPLCSAHAHLKARAVRRGDGPWTIE